jgi:hypothetical protein
VLSRSNKNKVLQGFVKHVDQECGKIRARIRDSSYSIPFFATMIWAFFLFDVYGNSEGYAAAIWVIVLVIVPITLFAIRQLKEYYIAKYPPMTPCGEVATNGNGEGEKAGDCGGEGKGDQDDEQNHQQFGRFGAPSPSKRERQDSDSSIRASGMFLRASQRFNLSPVIGLNTVPGAYGGPLKTAAAVSRSTSRNGESTMNPMAVQSQSVAITEPEGERSESKDPENGFEDVEVVDF